MCGRFTLSKPVRSLAEVFMLAEPPAELTPRYNIAPGQPIAAVALKADGVRRGLAMLSWGLVPGWSNDPKQGIKPINARADSLGKPTFRKAFEQQRCLIPADGFYEWQTVGKKKQPIHFRMKDGELFAFAGLWEVWSNGSDKLASCCLITTEANAVVEPFHNRMPVIVPLSAHAAWLDADTPMTEIRELLRPYPAGDMESRAVNPWVNSAKNEGPECLNAI